MTTPPDVPPSPEVHKHIMAQMAARLEHASAAIDVVLVLMNGLTAVRDGWTVAAGKATERVRTGEGFPTNDSVAAAELEALLLQSARHHREHAGEITRLLRQWAASTEQLKGKFHV